MMKLIDPVTYPITPDQIDIRRHFFDAFDNREREISANWIVWFCQRRGAGWQPFTLADINGFCHANGHPKDLRLNGLDTRGYLVFRDGAYWFTHEFIAHCFLASPAS